MAPVEIFLSSRTCLSLQSLTCPDVVGSATQPYAGTTDHNPVRIPMPWSFGVGACALIELSYPLPYPAWLKERDLFPHSYEDKKSKNKVLTGECSEVTLLGV